MGRPLRLQLSPLYPVTERIQRQYVMTSIACSTFQIALPSASDILWTARLWRRLGDPCINGGTVKREVTELPWNRHALDRPFRSTLSSTTNTIKPLRDPKSPLLLVVDHRIGHGSPGTSVVIA
jgi:hypothetical protein